MKYYELIYLASSDLSEKINGFIQEEAGTIEKTTKPLKREKEFLASLNFYLIPEKLENLKKKLDSEKQILRYMILAKKPLKKTRFKEVLTKKTKFQEAADQHPEAKKVELEEIDKKIDEILKE